MKATNKTKATTLVLCGVLALCLLLLVLAARELMVVVGTPALVLEPLPSILRLFCLSFAATAVLAVWVFILTRRRDIWACLLDANESIRVRLGLPAMWTRSFSETRVFTILVSVLFGLFVLATVATVAAYFYLKGI